MDREKRTYEPMPDHYGTGRQPFQKKSLLSVTLLLFALLIGTNLVTLAFMMGYSVGKSRQDTQNAAVPTQLSLPEQTPERKEIAAQLQDSLAEVVTPSGNQTGVVLSADGYIMTTAADGETLCVRIGGTEYTQVHTEGTDPDSGLTVLKIDANGLQPISIGFSGVLTAQEEGMLRFGSPLSRQGVLEREESSSQTEVPIGGESRRVLLGTYEKGDLLLNDEGQLTAFCVEVSRGVVALPMEEAINLAGELIAFGTLNSPHSPGIEIAQLDEAQSFYWDLPGSIMISRIRDGGSAQEAGLQEGDVLLKIGSTEITDPGDFWQAITACQGSKTVTVTVYRGSEELELQLNIQ